MKRKSLPYGSKSPFELTLRERDLIIDETFCDPGFAKLTVVDGEGIRADLTLEDIEEILRLRSGRGQPYEKVKIAKGTGSTF